MEPTYRPASLPSASAVSINIFEPKAYAGPAQAPAQAPIQQPVVQNTLPGYYNYPTAPVYDYNSSSYYNVPSTSVYGQPPVMPQPTPVQNVPQEVAPANQFPVMPTPVPVAPMPQPATAPVVPPPSAIDQQTVAQPTAQQPQAAQPAAQPAQAEAQQAQPKVDLQTIQNALQSQNPDEQAAAIQKIAEIGQATPEDAAKLIDGGKDVLLNEQVFRGLTKIITRDKAELKQINDALTVDSTKLTGQQLADAEAAKATAMKNINNIKTGIWTLAVMQKNFRETMNVETQKQGLQPISMNDLPGIVQVVENLKSNPIPELRDASISALTYIAKPEDQQSLATLFDIASKQDPDPNVKAAAQQALSMVTGPQEAPAQAAPTQAAPAQAA